MAFNNGFPMTYPQMYAQPYQQPIQNQPASGIIWVQGESGAKSYLTAPNSTVVLFDSESQTIYLKSADAAGLPSLRVLDYTIRDQKPNSGVFAAKSENYATKQEIDALRAEIDKLKVRLKGGHDEPVVRTDAE